MGYPCDCRHSLADEHVDLPSNPDVAGIGVLVGLTLPALATSVLLLIYYLSAVDPEDLDMWTKLDVSFLKWLHAKRPGWRTDGAALERVILSFSDAQLVNAFSLLLGAFTMGCSMDPYHWQIMVQCVWFTSATHLATIPILRAQLYRSNLGHSISRLSIYMRATLMTLVLAMLVSSLVPTGHPQWIWGSNIHHLEGMTLPALCFFDYKFLRESGPEAAQMTTIGGILLSWSIGLATVTFVERLFELVTSPKKPKTVSTQPMPTDEVRTWSNPTDQHTRRHPILRFFWHSSKKTLRGVTKLFASFGGHIFWLFIMLSWNIYLVVYNKWTFQQFVEDGDNKWGFGQTTPLVLFILPAMTIVEQYFAKKDHVEEGWPTMNSQSSQPVIGNHHDDSIRITVFLMFEFLLIFALLAWLNFVSGLNVTRAVSNLGYTFLAPFLLCMLLAPLVFSFIIHLADNIFKAMKLGKNTWRDGIIAAIVALGIGSAICSPFF